MAQQFSNQQYLMAMGLLPSNYGSNPYAQYAQTFNPWATAVGANYSPYTQMYGGLGKPGNSPQGGFGGRSSTYGPSGGSSYDPSPTLDYLTAMNQIYGSLLGQQMSNQNAYAIAEGNANTSLKNTGMQTEAQKYGYDTGLQGQKYTADQALQQALAAANASMYGSDKSAGASMYGANQAANANMYGANQAANASMYGADVGANAQKYGYDTQALMNQLTQQTNLGVAGLGLEGTKYGADQALAAAQAQAEAQRYGSDINKDIAGINAETQALLGQLGLTGTKYTADQSLNQALAAANASMYGSDQSLAGTRYTNDTQRLMNALTQSTNKDIAGIGAMSAKDVAQINAFAQMFPNLLKQQRYNEWQPLLADLFSGLINRNQAPAPYMGPY